MPSPAPYATIRTETHGEGTARAGLIVLNRPQALNALNAELVAEVNAALDAFMADEAVGAVVLTGSEKAFAAGADIKEIQSLSFPATYLDDMIEAWDRVSKRRKPIIAAVAGFALGGGCELAMMCDIILAADTAKFGQPEIRIGVVPGAGGSQRMTRAIGKAKTMDLCLTGRMMDAAEAERSGLVARVIPAADLVAEALKTAIAIAGMSRAGVLLTKELVNSAFETSLAEGLRLERRMFQAMFGTPDQQEGMAAFVEKRPPAYKGR